MSAALLTKRQAILPGSLQLSPKRRCKIRHFCLQISGICTCKKHYRKPPASAPVAPASGPALFILLRPSQVELHFSGLRSKKSLVVPTYFVDCHKTAISYCVTVLPQKTIFVISAFSLYHTNPTAAPSLIIFAASFSVTFLQFDLTSIPDSSTSYTQE